MNAISAHKCGIREVREFVMSYAIVKCRKNVLHDGEYKVTLKCFGEWHVLKFGIQPLRPCIYALALYLPLIAEELGFKVVKEGPLKYILVAKCLKG